VLISVRIRTRLYAAAVKRNCQFTRAPPRCLSFRIPPTVFIQPKTSSMRLRTRWLTAYPAWRVVRRSSVWRRDDEGNRFKEVPLPLADEVLVGLPGRGRRAKAD